MSVVCGIVASTRDELLLVVCVWGCEVLGALILCFEKVYRSIVMGADDYRSISHITDIKRC